MPTYAGASACGECHEAQWTPWRGSSHAQAGGRVQPHGVRGVFDGVRREFASATFSPDRNGGVVGFRLGGEGASLTPVVGTLGRDLQQYVVPGARGRLQVLPMAFDAHRGDWFDVFPEAPAATDWAHWTQPGMTANAQCLFCHTTGFQRGYRLETDSWDTQWAEDGVSCEACHGPGSRHIAARRRGEVEPNGGYGGHAAARTCAPCHGRGPIITPEVGPGAVTEDVMDLELLDTDQFHADGSLRGEAFEWVSFGASLMAQRGVTCQDCHEPHGGTLRADGNALCLQCHGAELASPSHTHHDPSGSGGACVACHMPQQVFMERDVRHDHRLGIPDPATAAAIGAPDPCTTCHAGESQAWAAEQVTAWYGRSERRAARRRVTAALAAGRLGNPAALDDLVALVGQGPDVVRRATAARLLRQWVAQPTVLGALRTALGDDSSMVRAAAAFALGEAERPAPDVTPALVAAVRDPVRLVRHNAAFALRGVALDGLAPDDRARVEAAFAEWTADQQYLGDLPEPHHNLGLFFTARGRPDDAMTAYRRAVERWPDRHVSRHNLAMLLLETGREAEAERELATILEREPGWPPAALALGLLQGRQQRWDDAARSLSACVATDPRYPRAQYNLGRVRMAQGDLGAAAIAFERAIDDPESRADALRELVRVAYKRGDRAGMERWIGDALAADPTVSGAPELREFLAGDRSNASMGGTP